ncbi:hypothetical protein GDI1028 [Gluconacetobacter diazotrophicus PA1 5]|uniref:Uncharacterized protein n=1 Tax=Gluconacetobacter diazotrophicus (strain ATCC 49037 / DSM 5601 / CCUG 37298 / CIP 103539 / LMG 7603 / PAl5) TaxID=272568 RepID=A9HCP5_GLUDA|nr:hypothetical protein GDI1028 [Gluconacetobacter diazotrophicus PA1 5]
MARRALFRAQRRLICRPIRGWAAGLSSWRILPSDSRGSITGTRAESHEAFTCACSRQDIVLPVVLDCTLPHPPWRISLFRTPRSSRHAAEHSFAAGHSRERPRQFAVLASDMTGPLFGIDGRTAVIDRSVELKWHARYSAPGTFYVAP